MVFGRCKLYVDLAQTGLNDKAAYMLEWLRAHFGKPYPIP